MSSLHVSFNTTLGHFFSRVTLPRERFRAEMLEFFVSLIGLHLLRAWPNISANDKGVSFFDESLDFIHSARQLKKIGHGLSC